MLADVDQTKANEAVEELRLAGHEATCVVGDALDEAFPSKAVEAALNAFGKVNCLINNAGTYPSIQYTVRSLVMFRDADHPRVLLRQRHPQDER